MLVSRCWPVHPSFFSSSFFRSSPIFSFFFIWFPLQSLSHILISSFGFDIISNRLYRCDGVCVCSSSFSLKCYCMKWTCRQVNKGDIYPYSSSTLSPLQKRYPSFLQKSKAHGKCVPYRPHFDVFYSQARAKGGPGLRGRRSIVGGSTNEMLCAKWINGHITGILLGSPKYRYI